MATPLPNATSHVTMPDFLNWANLATGNYFGILFLILIFAVTFFALKRFTTGRALMASSFVTLISSIILRAMGLVPAWILIIFAILFTGSTMYSLFAKD